MVRQVHMHMRSWILGPDALRLYCGVPQSARPSRWALPDPTERGEQRYNMAIKYECHIRLQGGNRSDLVVTLDAVGSSQGTADAASRGPCRDARAFSNLYVSKYTYGQPNNGDMAPLQHGRSYSTRTRAVDHAT